MLVGEQPGDREDIEGRPFVGPAGRILDRGLELAEIDHDEVFLTNVVKHFRYKRAESAGFTSVLIARTWQPAGRGSRRS